MGKLPDERRLIVIREHKGDWELNPIIQAVKSEVEARSRVQFFHLSKDSLQLQGKSYNSGYINPTASALLSGNRGESSIACFVKETIECLISMLCQILTRGGIFVETGEMLYLSAPWRTLGPQLRLKKSLFWIPWSTSFSCL